VAVRRCVYREGRSLLVNRLMNPPPKLPVCGNGYLNPVVFRLQQLDPPRIMRSHYCIRVCSCSKACRRCVIMRQPRAAVPLPSSPPTTRSTRAHQYTAAHFPPFEAVSKKVACCYHPDECLFIPSSGSRGLPPPRPQQNAFAKIFWQEEV
jgi:hypothetical protein